MRGRAYGSEAPSAAQQSPTQTNNVESCDYHVTKTTVYTLIVWYHVTNLDKYAESVHGLEVVL